MWVWTNFALHPSFLDAHVWSTDEYCTNIETSRKREHFISAICNTTCR